MERNSKRHIKQNIAKSFGSLGYLLCFLQWLWSVALYFSVIQSLSLVVSPTGKQVEQAPTVTFHFPGPIETIILVIVVVAVVALVAYGLMKMPTTIVKTSDTIVRRATETIAPAIIKAQHKKDTKQNRAIITPKVIIGMKLLLVITPLVLDVASGLQEKLTLNYAVALIVASGLASFSVMAFAIQYLLASLFHAKMSDLR